MLLLAMTTLACMRREPYYPPPDSGDTTADTEADTDTDTDTDTDADTDSDTDADTDTDTDTDTASGPCAGRTVGTANGECAPNFSLVDVDGELHNLWDDYLGRVVILEFSGFT